MFKRSRDSRTNSKIVLRKVCKGRLKSAAGGAEWRGGRKVRRVPVEK
jgi:hypothetical protein